MGKCFINEDIEFDIIYSDNERNVIKVDNRKEIFFEVYESIIDDKKIVLEKIGEFGGLPIVTVEFKQNGKIYTCEALLEDDNKNQLVVNEDNLYFLRDEKNLKNNIYVEKTEVETTSGTDVVAETKLNIQHTYDEKIKEYEDKKFTFLEDIENQFEEKINLLKDDIGEKLDTFFEKLDKKKEEIISEKLDEVTSEIDNKFELLKTELQNVEEFSKNNIDSILEKKVTDIDSSVNNFLEDLTKTYKDRFKDSDKKSVGNYLNLKSLTEKYNKNKEDTDNKIKDLFDLKNKLLEQDDLIIKNKELLEFINDEFNTINNKFLYLTEKENEKYNELLAAVSKKDVVEYKTILKEKIQDVELGLVKEEIRDEISENFRNEITSLKRYAEMSSGGGTNAVQYANGGTMNGDLTVNGTMKADTIIATTLLSAVTLDIGFELSGFNVTGSISANGDITGNRVIAINTLSANGNLYPQTIATRGQVIVANDDGNLIFGHGEKIHLEIRNDEGSDISAGTPVYSKGEIGGSERILVGKADANDSSKMPAIGIAETTLNTTDAKDGFAIINGVYNENISGFTNLIEGKNLYVASGGGLTNVKPTGVNNLIQNIGTILKVGGGGSILQGMKVSSIDRTNDIPNLSAKAIFYGQGDYYAQRPLSGAIIDATGVTLEDSNIFADSIKSCSISACNLFVDDTDGKLDLKNNSICFTTVGSNARIEHHDRSGSACDLIINASDNCGTSTGSGGDLILSAGSSYNEAGSTGGNVIICAGDGHIGAGDIILNACDSALGNDGQIIIRACSSIIEKGYLRVCNKICTTNQLIASAIKIGASQATNEFTVDTTGRIHSLDGAHIGGTLSAQSFESQTISATNCAGFRVNLLAGTCGGKIGMGHPSATIASGAVSVAIGGGYDASGGGGPLGQVKASGTRSVAIGGTGALASGTGSVAMGGSYIFCSRACGNYSLSINDGNAKSNYAIAIGRESLACCNASIAMGGYGAAKSRGKGAIALGGALYSNTRAYGDYSAVIGGAGQGGQGSGVYCHNLICKGAEKAAIIGGGLNTIQKAACNSAIIGGSHNIALSGCSFILGHGLIGAKEKTVFVNNLSAQNDIHVNGQLLGGVSQNKICNSSFTLADSDNGKNIFIDTTSGSVNVTVNCMTSGFATRFIYEGGSNPISFISGAGLSGLNSYLGRTQMNVIHSQADINFRSERYAFLGGNLA